MSTINLSGVVAAEENVSSFNRVEPGLHTLTIKSLEMAKSGDKDVLKVTFSSKEADAEFSHNFFLTEKALPRVQYLITKFTGNPLEGTFEVNALSAILVGKTKPVIVDGRVVGREKDGRWYNNTYAELRFAGFVLDDPSTFVNEEGHPNGYRIDRRGAVDVEALNAGGSTSSSSSVNDDLPF